MKFGEFLQKLRPLREVKLGSRSVRWERPGCILEYNTGKKTYLIAAIADYSWDNGLSIVIEDMDPSGSKLSSLSVDDKLEIAKDIRMLLGTKKILVDIYLDHRPVAE